MRVLLTTLAAALVLAAPASAASPDIVISQVYGGGGNAGAQYKNDFIELYNRGTEAGAGHGLERAVRRSRRHDLPADPADRNDPPGALLPRPGGGRRQRRRHRVDLPTPNAEGTIAMAAGAGKVALVTNNTTLTCGADCDGAAALGVKDFVGYGAANDSETAADAGLSNSTAAQRLEGGNVDTDNNLLDFMAGAPNPRNTPPPASITSHRPGRRRERRAARQQRHGHVQRSGRRRRSDHLREQRRPRVHPDRRPDRVHARPDDRFRARRELHGHRPHRGPRRRLQLHDARARGPAHPRHPGRAAPLAVREPRRQRRARRRDRREHERHLGPGPAAGRRQPHVRGHLPVQPERAAADRHRGHVQRRRSGVQGRRLGAREPVADRDRSGRP